MHGIYYYVTRIDTSITAIQAEACRSIEQAMKKCPNGFYAEIKYDGERVQVHKNGDTFEFFSRSLKNVQPHKVCTYHLIVPQGMINGH